MLLLLLLCSRPDPVHGHVHDRRRDDDIPGAQARQTADHPVHAARLLSRLRDHRTHRPDPLDRSTARGRPLDPADRLPVHPIGVVVRHRAPRMDTPRRNISCQVSELDRGTGRRHRPVVFPINHQTFTTCKGGLCSAFERLPGKIVHRFFGDA